MSRLLPIGTVVITSKTPTKLMIVGYGGQDSEELIYDYIGVAVPVGLFEKNAVSLFNDSQVVELAYIGFTDAETQIYLTKLEAEFSDVMPVMLGNEEEVEDV